MFLEHLDSHVLVNQDLTSFFYLLFAVKLQLFDNKLEQQGHVLMQN